MASPTGGGDIVDDAMVALNENQRRLRMTCGDWKVVMRIISVLRAVLDASQLVNCERGDEPFKSCINADK